MKLGVNLAGADFGSGKLPGTLGTDYTYPTSLEIDYYAGKGISVVRLPFLWERVQPTENDPLSTNELAQMDSVVGYAASRGLQVILEPHNFGSGYGHPVGSAETPDSAFADLWSRLAGHFAGSSNVIFGLMNEPHQQTAQQWLGSANAAIAAIRAGGAGQQILVPGSYWTGAHSWVSTDNDTVIGPGIRDPLGNFAFEVHQYLDSDSSGTHANVVSANIGVERLTAVTQWAEATGSRLFLGEFGVAQDPVSLAALANMVAYMKAHPVWEGATYWAAGPWWGDYMFSIEPTGLGTGSVVDRPQMDVLEAFLGAVTGQTGTGSRGNDLLNSGTGNAAVFGQVETRAASTTGAVYGLYEALLDRAPDPLGLQSFTTAIQSGASLTDVANAILGSPEHAGRPLAGAAYVESLYTGVLNRSADAGGLAAFTGALVSGTSAAAVAVQIATSAEAQGVLQPAFDDGVYVPDAITAGVARLYHGVLGRAPDTTGLQAFSGVVRQGATGAGLDGALKALAGVAGSFLSSTEYAGMRGGLPDAAFVDSLYVGALGRHAEAAGSAYWTGQLAQGVSRAVVATQIVESAEAQVHLVGQIELGQYLIA